VRSPDPAATAAALAPLAAPPDAWDSRDTAAKVLGDVSPTALTAPPLAAPTGAAPAAPPIDAPPVQAPPVPVHAPGLQLAVALKQAAKPGGTDRIEIQLRPASLGAVDVQLNVAHDGRVTAVIAADRADTLDLLRRDASGLEQALRDAGLQADSGSLSFNLRGESRSFSQGAPHSPPSATGAYVAGPDDAPAADLPAPTRRRHAGRLDIHV
jgi:hypothetical protein